MSTAYTLTSVWAISSWIARPAMHLHGKGRKERVVPLWKQTAAQVREWLARIDRTALAPVFPNRAGRPLSRSGVEHRLQVVIATASGRCPSPRNPEKSFGATAIEPQPNPLLEALTKPGTFDLLHIACHVEAEAGDVRSARIVLEGRVQGGNFVPTYMAASTG